MSAAEQEWEPGDPLYSPGSYRDYFFNFRPLNDEFEECSCPDRSSWPDPAFGSHTVPDEDYYITKWKKELGLTDG